MSITQITQSGPLLRRRNRSLIWSGRPFATSPLDTRDGDFLLSPSGNLVNSGRRSRALARRQVDGVWQWAMRTQPVIDKDGVRVEGHIGGTIFSYLIRSMFDAGLTGWSTTIPAGAAIAAETTTNRYLFAADVATQNILMTQASPAAGDNILRQTWTTPGGWSSPYADVCFAVGHLDGGAASNALSLVVRRTSDSRYYDWAGGWQVAVAYYDLPLRTTVPTIDFARVYLDTIAAGTQFEMRVVQRSGVTGGAINRVYYCNVHDKPYFMSPIRNTSALSTEQRGTDWLWLPNYVSCRCFPSSRGTISIWLKPDWSINDTISSSMWTKTFGLFTNHHDPNNYDAAWVIQNTKVLTARCRHNGTNYDATKTLTAFGREQWSHVAVRWTGTNAELGLPAGTLSVFADGVKGTDATVAQALVENDYAQFMPYSFQSNAGTANFNFDGVGNQMEIFYDVLTDQEIAAIYAAGPGV